MQQRFFTVLLDVVQLLTMNDSTPPPPPPPDDSAVPPPPTGTVGSPTDFLKNVVGKKVKVRLISGVDYRGMYFSI